MSVRSAWVAAPLLLLAAGCDLSSRPPDGAPGGLRGMVTYRGAPLTCVGGRPTGNLVLRVLDHDAAAGEAARVVAVLDGDRVFDGTGCGAPELPPVEISAAFVLNGIGPPPGSRTPMTLRLEALWDADGDYDSAGALRASPTRGDVMGGAYVDPSASPLVFTRLEFGPAVDHPEGQRIEDVQVTVDARVHSELPLFRLGAGTRPLGSDALVSGAADVVDRDRELWELTQATFELLPVAEEPYRSALSTAGLSVDDLGTPRAFWSIPFDSDGDGAPDRHPVLGDGLLDEIGRTWRTPTIVLRRARTRAEERGGVPDVYLYPAVRPSETTVKEVFAPSVPVLVPPIAIMALDPALPVCNVPVLAPGNDAARFEGRPVSCQELPTGRYDITLRQGIAGGTLSAGVPATISDTGFRVAGGRYVEQSWTIPNALGDLVIDQGESARFLVVDRDTATAPDATSTVDGHGVEACALAPDPATGTPRAPAYVAVAPACCEPVRHLCGLPLCEPATAGDGFVREASSLEGEDRPSCLPFLVPPSCCR